MRFLEKAKAFGITMPSAEIIVMYKIAAIFTSLDVTIRGRSKLWPVF
jgi:hypothetical protein